MDLLNKNGNNTENTEGTVNCGIFFLVDSFHVHSALSEKNVVMMLTLHTH